MKHSIPQSAPIEAAADKPTQIVAAPGAGKRIMVFGYEVHLGTMAGTYQFFTGNTPLTGIIPKGITGGAARDGGEYPIYVCGENEPLTILTVGASAHGGIMYTVTGA